MKLSQEYRTEKNKLLIEDDEIVFDFSIDSYIEIEGMLIVLLDIPPKIKYNENVFGVSLFERKIKWQIEKRKYPLEKFTKLNCNYNGIVAYENKARLNNWCDTYLLVDPLTGKILEEGYMR